MSLFLFIAWIKKYCFKKNTRYEMVAWNAPGEKLQNVKSNVTGFFSLLGSKLAVTVVDSAVFWITGIGRWLSLAFYIPILLLYSCIMLSGKGSIWKKYLYPSLASPIDCMGYFVKKSTVKHCKIVDVKICLHLHQSLRKDITDIN